MARHDADVIDELAALEHEQWMTWAKDIIEEEDISDARAHRWMQYFIPYEELDEDIKELDRVWARKAFNMVVEYLVEKFVGLLEEIKEGKYAT